MGTYNSGCAKLEVPVLNQDPNGPMLMVSHANTNPGLTKTWDPGEPDKYYPTGKRNYARVDHHRRLPGRGGRPVRGPGPQGQEVLRPQRQPDLRPGRREGVRRPRPAKQGITVLGNEAVGRASSRTTRRSSRSIKAHEPGLRLPRRHLRQQRRPADQGQGRRARRQHQGQADGAGRLHRLPGPGQAARGRRAMYLTFAGLSTTQLVQAAAVRRRSCSTPTRRSTAGRRPPATRSTACGAAGHPRRDREVGRHPQERHGRRCSAARGITSRPTSPMLGKEIKIDPQTGDVNTNDISDRCR